MNILRSSCLEPTAFSSTRPPLETVNQNTPRKPLDLRQFGTPCPQESLYGQGMTPIEFRKLSPLDKTPTRQLALSTSSRLLFTPLTGSAPKNEGRTRNELFPEEDEENKESNRRVEDSLLRLPVFPSTIEPVTSPIPPRQRSEYTRVQIRDANYLAQKKFGLEISRVPTNEIIRFQELHAPVPTNFHQDFSEEDEETPNKIKTPDKNPIDFLDNPNKAKFLSLRSSPLQKFNSFTPNAISLSHKADQKFGRGGLAYEDGKLVPVALCCTCKKSRCLKLYCECYASKSYCSGCSCVGCCNIPECKDMRETAMKQTLDRNPNAFDPKIARTSESVLPIVRRQQNEGRNYENALQTVDLYHARGCHCKRSSCLKRYCECYQSGAFCSALCKCDSCKNSKEEVGVRLTRRNTWNIIRGNGDHNSENDESSYEENIIRKRKENYSEEDIKNSIRRKGRKRDRGCRNRKKKKLEDSELEN